MNIRKTLGDKIRKSAKFVSEHPGKVAATVVCPPLGGFLWGKGPKGRILGAAAGIISSVFLNMFIFASSGKIIYEFPTVGIYKVPRSVVGVSGMFVSPLAFGLDSHFETDLEKDGIHYWISGDDVITFNDRKYSLNFGPEKKFGTTEKTLGKAQRQVRNYQEVFDEYLKEGDLRGAKDIKYELGRARRDLRNISKRHNGTITLYDDVRNIFQNIVDKMNSELESLSKSN